MALSAAKAVTSSGEPFALKHHARMFLACLSYANLCFINVWAELADRGYDFLRKYSITWQKVAAASLDILIVALAVWGILYLALSSGNSKWIRVVKWAAIPGLLLPFNVIRTDEAFVSLRQAYAPQAPVLQATLILLGAAIGLLLLFKWERLSTRMASSLLILLAPSMPLAVVNAGWRVWAGPAHSFFPNKALQPALPQPAGAPHLIWVIFDEWDQALTFGDRPEGLLLPELDRFRNESFHAGKVYPPARLTIISVPSLITGKTFVTSTPAGYDDLTLTYDQSSPPVPLTTQSTIFSEARHRGFNVGIVGWYLPYCRLIPDCTVCMWSSALGFSGREETEYPSVLRSMGHTFRQQVRKIPGAHRLGIDFEEPIAKGLHATAYRQLHDDMLRTIVDPRLNLTFVHMNVPHPPAIYVAATDAMSRSRDTVYTDNLRLVDRTVHDLRRTLEQAGMWDTTTILITADHPLRLKGWPARTLARSALTQHEEVPYLLKLAGQKQGLAYDKAMQEIVTKDLLLAILAREVTEPKQVAAWLDHHSPHQ